MIYKLQDGSGIIGKMETNKHKSQIIHTKKDGAPLSSSVEFGRKAKGEELRRTIYGKDFQQRLKALLL